MCKGSCCAVIASQRSSDLSKNQHIPHGAEVYDSIAGCSSMLTAWASSAAW